MCKRASSSAIRYIAFVRQPDYVTGIVVRSCGLRIATSVAIVSSSVEGMPSSDGSDVAAPYIEIAGVQGRRRIAAAES